MRVGGGKGVTGAVGRMIGGLQRLSLRLYSSRAALDGADSKSSHLGSVLLPLITITIIIIIITIIISLL